MRDKARAAGLLTPHIRADGSHLSQRATARVLQASGLSPLAPLSLNTAAPDEGNMLLLGSVATVAQKAHFLHPMVAGNARSAFLLRSEEHTSELQSLMRISYAAFALKTT